MREKNEDYFGSWNKKVFVVADGVGGYAAGEVAARLAVEEVIRRFQSESAVNDKVLEDAIKSANRKIIKTAAATPRYLGMATTVVSVLISADTLTFANVGDSRALLLRNRKLKRAVPIHRDKFGFLTQALGVKATISVSMKRVKAKTQDLVLLATDGLTDFVSKDTIQTVLESKEKLNQKTESLIELAIQKGGYDNITVCIIKLT